MLKAYDVMTRPLATCAPDTSVTDVAATMRDRDALVSVRRRDRVPLSNGQGSATSASPFKVTLTFRGDGAPRQLTEHPSRIHAQRQTTCGVCMRASQTWVIAWWGFLVGTRGHLQVLDRMPQDRRRIGNSISADRADSIQRDW